MVIALGANLPRGAEPPEATLARAVDALDATPDVAIAARSRLFRTPAVPAGSGPDFVNAAVRIVTGLAPDAVLARLHGIEAALGRTRPGRWAPRACDLDLIAAGSLVLPDRETLARWMALGPDAARSEAPDRLILPHPRLQERAFVLVPLDEVAPAWRHPLTGLDAAQMLARLPGPERDAIRPLHQA